MRPEPTGLPGPAEQGVGDVARCGRSTVLGVNAKTRIRIVTGGLVLLFVVVVVASALGGH
ncbi:hypothetical protein DEH18_02070 [Streptomyces sp. NHF165]|nr:hypothetical protein DEH18_02070 [Streptomyces sp. NHF165]